MIGEQPGVSMALITLECWGVTVQQTGVELKPTQRRYFSKNGINDKLDYINKSAGVASQKLLGPGSLGLGHKEAAAVK
jgi:hypothetical protein